MNRLAQVGIGFGLTAGAVLFPQPAAAETPPQQHVVVAGEDSNLDPHVTYANPIEGMIHSTNEQISDIFTPNISAVIPEFSLGYGELGQDRSDYYGPLALVLGAVALVGLGTRKISQRIAIRKDMEHMYGQVDTYGNMDIDTFNFVAKSYFNLNDTKEE
jgi:hypothetical protein